MGILSLDTDRCIRYAEVNIALIAATVLAAQETTTEPQRGGDRVKVSETFSACMVPPYERTEEWTRAGDGHRCDQRWMSRAHIDELRRLILSSKQDPLDVVATLGVTPESVAEHRVEVLELLSSLEGYAFGKPLPPPPGIEELLRFENLSQHILDYTLDRKGWSTTHNEIRVTLPGDPSITISSRGLEGWMLPWEIDAGGQIWISARIEISKALLPFVSDDSPNRGILDGTSYWKDDLWSDLFFWSELYDKLDAVRWSARYAEFPNYDKVTPWFRVESSRAGTGGQPASIIVELTALASGAIDRVLWWNRIDDCRPAFSWDDFLVVHDDAEESVRRCKWIEDWKRTSSDYRVCLHAAGQTGFADLDLNQNVLPAWEDAAFSGHPSIEIWLYRGATLAGKVYLSHAEPVALIAVAHPGEGGHWFDKLDISFHPRAPTYVRVDSSGRWEMRTVPPRLRTQR